MRKLRGSAKMPKTIGIGRCGIDSLDGALADPDIQTRLWHFFLLRTAEIATKKMPKSSQTRNYRMSSFVAGSRRATAAMAPPMAALADPRPPEPRCRPA